MRWLFGIAALMLVGVTAHAGPIEQHSFGGLIEQHPSVGIGQTPVQDPDATTLIKSMLGTWIAKDDDRIFTFKSQNNLTIVMMAVDMKCIYSNFVAPKYSKEELEVVFHCADESWQGSGIGLFKFVRIGSALLMIESSLIEREAAVADAPEGVGDRPPPEEPIKPRLDARVFLKSQ